MIEKKYGTCNNLIFFKEVFEHYYQCLQYKHEYNLYIFNNEHMSSMNSILQNYNSKVELHILIISLNFLHQSSKI